MDGESVTEDADFSEILYGADEEDESGAYESEDCWLVSDEDGVKEDMEIDFLDDSLLSCARTHTNMHVS